MLVLPACSCSPRKWHQPSSSLSHAIISHSSLLGNSEVDTYFFPACRRLYWHAAGTQGVDIQNFSALIAQTINHARLVAYSKIRRVWFHEFCMALAARLSCLHVICIEYERQYTKLYHLVAFYELLKRFASTLCQVEVSGTLLTQTTSLRNPQPA